MKKQLTLLGVMCILAINLYAQTDEKKWNIGLHGGSNQYDGDLGNDFYQTDQAFYGFGGLSISAYLGKHFDLNLMGTMGQSGFIDKENDKGSFHVKLNTASLNLRFNFTKPGAAVRPFLTAGACMMMWDRDEWTLPTDEEDMRTDFVPGVGGGLTIPLGETVNLQILEYLLLTSDDDIDKFESGGDDKWLMHTVGLTFNLGKKKDADGDDVSDKKDKCPNTPPGVAVDAAGCPIDTDKDGVADYQDDCKTEAGVAALKGCPDKDGDGVADKEDRCVDVKGLAALKGCPDADSDGVADMDDKCADTKAGYRVDATGCPMDNDKDGVVNEEDACMDVAGPVALRGCPDTDGDGVADIEDKCPTVVGTLVNKGCPEITKEDEKKIRKIASSIYFETNKDKIKSVSFPQLDLLVDLMAKYDQSNISIEGHTDSQGDDTYNMSLSQRRCDAVKAYLVKKGVDPGRLTAKGYGESMPVGDNKTASGRAKNRRVELKASY